MAQFVPPPEPVTTGQPDSGSLNTLLTIYELTQKEILSIQENFIYGISIVLLSAVGLLAWYLLKEDGNVETAVYEKLSKSPTITFLSILLLFFPFMYLASKQVTVISLRCINAAIEQQIHHSDKELLKWKRELSDVRKVTEKVLPLSTYADEIATEWFLKTLHDKKYAHSSAGGILLTVSFGSLFLTLLAYKLIRFRSSWARKHTKTMLGLAIGVFYLLMSFYVELVKDATACSTMMGLEG